MFYSKKRLHKDVFSYTSWDDVDHSPLGINIVPKVFLSFYSGVLLLVGYGIIMRRETEQTPFFFFFLKDRVFHFVKLILKGEIKGFFLVLPSVLLWKKER